MDKNPVKCYMTQKTNEIEKQTIDIIITPAKNITNRKKLDNDIIS